MSDQDLPKGLWEWSSGEGRDPGWRAGVLPPVIPACSFSLLSPLWSAGTRDSAAQGSSLRGLL